MSAMGSTANPQLLLIFTPAAGIEKRGLSPVIPTKYPLAKFICPKSVTFLHALHLILQGLES